MRRADWLSWACQDLGVAPQDVRLVAFAPLPGTAAEARRMAFDRYGAAEERLRALGRTAYTAYLWRGRTTTGPDAERSPQLIRAEVERDACWGEVERWMATGMAEPALKNILVPDVRHGLRYLEDIGALPREEA